MHLFAKVIMIVWDMQWSKNSSLQEYEKQQADEMAFTNQYSCGAPHVNRHIEAASTEWKKILTRRNPVSQYRPSHKCEQIFHSVETFVAGLHVAKSISQATVLHIYIGS